MSIEVAHCNLPNLGAWRFRVYRGYRVYGVSGFIGVIGFIGFIGFFGSRVYSKKVGNRIKDK